MRNSFLFVSVAFAAMGLPVLRNGEAAGRGGSEYSRKFEGLPSKKMVDVHVKSSKETFRQLDPVEVVVRSENVSDETLLVCSMNGMSRYLIEVIWVGPPERGHSQPPGNKPTPAELRELGKPVARTNYSTQIRAPERSYFEAQRADDGRQPGTAVGLFVPGELLTNKVAVNLLFDMTRVGRYEIRMGLPVKDRSGPEHWVVWGDPIRVEIESYVPKN